MANIVKSKPLTAKKRKTGNPPSGSKPVSSSQNHGPMKDKADQILKDYFWEKGRHIFEDKNLSDELLLALSCLAPRALTLTTAEQGYITYSFTENLSSDDRQRLLQAWLGEKAKYFSCTSLKDLLILPEIETIQKNLLPQPKTKAHLYQLIMGMKPELRDIPLLALAKTRNDEIDNFFEQNDYLPFEKLKCLCLPSFKDIIQIAYQKDIKEIKPVLKELTRLVAEYEKQWDKEGEKPQITLPDLPESNTQEENPPENISPLERYIIEHGNQLFQTKLAPPVLRALASVSLLGLSTEPSKEGNQRFLSYKLAENTLPEYSRAILKNMLPDIPPEFIEELDLYKDKNLMGNLEELADYIPELRDIPHFKEKKVTSYHPYMLILSLEPEFRPLLISALESRNNLPDPQLNSLPKKETYTPSTPEIVQAARDQNKKGIAPHLKHLTTAITEYKTAWSNI